MRVVVVTGNLVYNAWALARLQRLADGQYDVAGAFIGDYVLPGSSGPAAAWRLLRQTGWHYTAFKAAETVALRAAVRTARRDIRLAWPGLTDLPQALSLPCQTTDDINSAVTLEQIAASRPDVVVSMLPQYIMNSGERGFPQRGTGWTYEGTSSQEHTSRCTV